MKLDEESLFQTLKMLAPGSSMHEGLENILRARTGALIVVGDSDEVMDLVNGGFKIDTEMNPTSLYELGKMDGAIILSSDGKKILYANTQLTPDPMIPTLETGTRHRTAERVARQTGALVISISQRRNIISLYRGAMKYVMRDVSVILAKANQAMQTLEKYRTVLEQVLTSLGAMEFDDLVTLTDVVTAIRRSVMVSRIAREIEKYVAELGSEGRLVHMQLDELMVGIEDEGELVVKDYLGAGKDEPAEQVWEHLNGWSSDDLLDDALIARALGYSGPDVNADTALTPRGYRILRKIPRLPMPVIENLVEEFRHLPEICNASIEELDDVEGIGEVRAKAINDGLRRLREHAILDRHM